VTQAKKYNAEQLMTVVLAPVVSEKSTFVADKNRQYVFRVADDATKPEIKAAVELMFKTKVDSVTVANVQVMSVRNANPLALVRSSKVLLTKNALAKLEELLK